MNGAREKERPSHCHHQQGKCQMTPYELICAILVKINSLAPWFRTTRCTSHSITAANIQTKFHLLGLWAINCQKAINAYMIQYDNINLERKGLIIDNNRGLIIIVVAALTNEIIIINNMLAVNIRKPPLPYVLYKKAMFGLVYPVTPCYRAHPPDQIVIKMK